MDNRLASSIMARLGNRLAKRVLTKRAMRVPTKCNASLHIIDREDSERCLTWLKPSCHVI